MERYALADRQGRIIEANDLSGTRYAMIEAATGRLLGWRDDGVAGEVAGGATPLGWVKRLHTALIGGIGARFLIGVSGLFLVATLLLAVVAALLRRERNRAMRWHRLFGLALFPVLLTLAVTGSYSIWPLQGRALIARVLPVVPKYEAKRPGDWTVSADRAFAIAHELFPDSVFTAMRPPKPDADYWRIRLRQPGETREIFGVTTVWVAGDTGAVLGVYDGIGLPLGNRIADGVHSVHNGEIGGLAGRLLVMAAGLALPGFFLTGLWSWRARRRAHRPAT